MVYAVIVPTYLVQPTWQSLLVLVSNSIVVVIGLVCSRLFRRDRVQLGTRLLLLATWGHLALSGVIYQEMGLVLSISCILLTLLVVTQALARRELVQAIVFGALVTYFIFGFDLLPATFTTWRIRTFASGLAYPIIGVMVLIAAIFLVVQFRNFSITAKFITAILGATLVAAVLLSVLVFYMSQTRLQTMIGSQLEYSANNQAVIIGEELYRQIAILQSLALDQGFVAAVKAANNSYYGTKVENALKLQQMDEEWRTAPDDNYLLIHAKMSQPMVKNLRAFRELYPDHVEVFITDRYGGIVATTNRTSDYDQSDEEWWQKTYSDGGGSTYIGVPEYDESSQTYAVNMAVPVRTVDGEVVGVLRTTYNVRAILIALENAKFGQTGQFDLVIPGEPVTLLNPDYEVKADGKVIKVLDDLGFKDYLQAEFQGETNLLSLAPVRGQEYSVDLTALNWSLLGYQTTEEAYAPVRNQLKVSMLVVYLLVGAMALLGYGISLILSRPILHLTGVAEKVSAGDFNVQATVTSKDEIGSLAKTFNSMTGQINGLIGSLEQRVADRTRAIETTTEVSRKLSTILDPQELVNQVVEQVQSAFNYYHAHIYLFDEKEENLVMVGGTGDAGRTMLARGHKIPRGRGLVGRAADTHMAVLVPDTLREPNWLSNPLLPETRAEAAVPIEAGEHVLGVLDVQHNVADGLAEEDIDLLRSIANQVAIAIQNARSFVETQRQVEREAMIGAISQKIRQTTSVDEALQVTVRELGRAVGAPQTRVRLGLAEVLEPTASGTAAEEDR
jgi:putative methionine-R-sulfoxide reductase with GAF domain